MQHAGARGCHRPSIAAHPRVIEWPGRKDDDFRRGLAGAENGGGCPETVYCLTIARRQGRRSSGVGSRLGPGLPPQACRSWSRFFDSHQRWIDEKEIGGGSREGALFFCSLTKNREKRVDDAN